MKRLAVLGLVAAGLAAAAEPLWVGRFDDGLAPWREVRLNDRLVPNVFTITAVDGVTALEVRSARSMSLMARPLEIDLAVTPVLCWRWRIDAPLVAADLGTKAGDDYAARVYVSLAVPPAQMGFALRAKLALARSLWGPELPDAALNYVWDNRHPVGTVRPNAYTDRTLMHVQRSGAANAGRWMQERRDVARDAAAFGTGVRVVQIAVTADTDNTGEQARAAFADLHWVAAGSPCAQGD